MYLLSDEDPMPYKAGKKDHRWCRCKVGREHKPTHSLKYSYLGPCRWTEQKWGSRKGTIWYMCNHSLICDVCGKILEWRAKTCPDKKDAPWIKTS